jgi:hypothetical protein
LLHFHECGRIHHPFTIVGIRNNSISPGILRQITRHRFFSAAFSSALRAIQRRHR